MRTRILKSTGSLALFAGSLLSCTSLPAQQLVPINRPDANFSEPVEIGKKAPALTLPSANPMAISGPIKPATSRAEDSVPAINGSFQSRDSRQNDRPKIVDNGDPYAPALRELPGQLPSLPTGHLPSSPAASTHRVESPQLPSATFSRSLTSGFRNSSTAPTITHVQNSVQAPVSVPSQAPVQWQQLSPTGRVTTQPFPTPPKNLMPMMSGNQQPSGAAIKAPTPTSTSQTFQSQTNAQPQFAPPAQIVTGVPAANGVSTTNRGPLDPSGLLSNKLPVATNGTELILQRYPDGKVEIARQVAQDEQGNYVNHGVWKEFQSNGQLVAAGTYHMGKRNGTWFRWHFADSVALLQETPYAEFKGPFLSRGLFDKDKLDGPWSIYDSQQRLISEINFRNDQRNGPATWHYATGQKFREIIYQDGKTNGHFREWNKQAKLTRQVIFAKGRPLIREVSHFDSERKMKEFEVNFLGGEIVMETPDKWGEMELATYASTGEKEKHGTEIVWYSNGQVRMKGQFEYGKPVGQFVWWHENGQKQLAGVYQSGDQFGQWTWWHPSGLKSIQGSYDGSDSTGLWTWWDPSGEVARQQDFTVSGPDGIDNEQSLADGDRSESDSSQEPGVPLLRARPISNKQD